MAPSVLTGRRRVRPRVSAPAVAPALRLSFGMLGFPFAEPAFATVVDPNHPLAAGGCTAPPAHGVLHVITRQEWAWICQTEGVGSSSAGYQVVAVEVEPYASRGAWPGPGAAVGAGGGTLKAVTLQVRLGRGSEGCSCELAVKPVASHAQVSSGCSRQKQLEAPPQRLRRSCRTMLPALQGAPASLHESSRNALPSRRYMDLLRTGEQGANPSSGSADAVALKSHQSLGTWQHTSAPIHPLTHALSYAPGAAHHGLDPSYRRYLEDLESYGAADAASSPWRTAGAAASAAVLLSAAAPALPLFAATRLLGGPGTGAPGSGDGARSGAKDGDFSNGGAAAGPEASPLAAASAYLGAVAMRATWAVHDVALSGLFGSGCSNGRR